jgi:hypothetical protein
MYMMTGAKAVLPLGLYTTADNFWPSTSSKVTVLSGFALIVCSHSPEKGLADPPAADVAAIIRPVITALDSNAMAATHKDVHPRMRGPRRAATTATSRHTSVKTVSCGPRSGHANEDHIA